MGRVRASRAARGWAATLMLARCARAGTVRISRTTVFLGAGATSAEPRTIRRRGARNANTVPVVIPLPAIKAFRGLDWADCRLTWRPARTPRFVIRRWSRGTARRVACAEAPARWAPWGKGRADAHGGGGSAGSSATAGDAHASVASNGTESLDERSARARQIALWRWLGAQAQSLPRRAGRGGPIGGRRG